MRVDKIIQKIKPNIGTFVLLLSLIFTSCVGTVEDLNDDTTLSSMGKALEINFSGIESAEAIAHDKAEVSFFPASGGSGDYTYLVFRDGVIAPITFPDEALETNHKGLYKVMITGLTPDTTYNFEVQVIDAITFARSLSAELKSTKTFTKDSCDFFGIANVTLPPGLDSTSSIIVDWPEATSLGGFTPFDGDPYQYVITLLDSDLLSAEDMNNSSYTSSDGRFLFYQQKGNAKTIYGLLPDKKYLVQVRCEHHGYNRNKGDPSYKVEKNTNILEVKTSSGAAGDLIFDDSSFKVRLNDGHLGKQSFIANWKAASGTFDHYRLYYSSKPLDTSSVAPLCEYDSVSETYCSKISFDQTSAVVSGLVQDETYNVQLLVCIDTSCTPMNKRSSSQLSIIMKPDLATFKGITEITRGENMSEVNKMRLNFEAPDFSTGVIDGLIVEWVDNGVSRILNDPAIVNNTGMTVNESIDLKVDTEIDINGFNPYVTRDYCFNLYPYIMNNDGEREYVVESNPASTNYCITPDIVTGVHLKMPENLGGACRPGSPQTLSVDFDVPLRGVFTHYEVFWKKGNLSSFNLNDAINTAGDDGSLYSVILIPESQSSMELAPLQTGQVYTTGVIGYYFGADGNEYRTIQNNSTISECTVF